MAVHVFGWPGVPGSPRRRLILRCMETNEFSSPVNICSPRRPEENVSTMGLQGAAGCSP